MQVRLLPLPPPSFSELAQRQRRSAQTGVGAGSNPVLGTFYLEALPIGAGTGLENRRAPRVLWGFDSLRFRFL